MRFKGDCDAPNSDSMNLGDKVKKIRAIFPRLCLIDETSPKMQKIPLNVVQ